jgi:copper transport protein
MSKLLRLTALFLLLGALLLPASTVSAHAELVRSEPAANAHLQRTPTRIDLYFTENVEAQQSEIAVYDSTSKRVDAHQTQLDPADPAHLFAPLPALKDGVYLVTWRVISSDDVHLSGGSFPILIGAVAASSLDRFQSAPAAPITLPGQVLVKGLLYLAAALVTGGTLFALFAGEPSIQESGVSQKIVYGYAQMVQRFLTAGTILLAAATLLGVLVQAAAFKGTFLAAPWDPQVLIVLTATRYGVLALTRLAALFLLAGTLLPPAGRWNRFAAVLLLALTLLTISLDSHAASEESLLPILSDTAHLAAASVWVGGLGLFLTSLLFSRRLPPDQRNRLAASTLPRFSTLALSSVAVLLLSGSYQAIGDIGTLGGLLYTPYGQVFLIKMLAALLMLGLGGYNHFISRARIAQAARLDPTDTTRVRNFRRLLSIEASLGAALLLWVGLFSSLPPANRNATQPRITRTVQVDDLRLNLFVSPGRPGVNNFSLQVLSSNNLQPVTSASMVMLEFYPADPSIPPSDAELISQQNGWYAAESANIPFQGAWQVRAIVSRPGRFDTYGEFHITAALPWNPPLEQISTILLACLAFSAGFAGVMLLKQKNRSHHQAVDQG